MVCVAADGNLWTPVIRPISVPVVSRRPPVPSSSDTRDTRTIPPQTSPFESRRATSLYSLPRGRDAVNGPTFVDGRPSNTGLHSGRPHSVENMDLRPVHSSPDRRLLHVAPHSSGEDHTARLSPSKFTDDYRRSLPRRVGHVTSTSTWSAPAEWSRDEMDRERSRSLSSDRRKYFPPLKEERSLRRDERGQQLENTRREVSDVYCADVL